MNYKLITLSVTSLIFIAIYLHFVYDYKESQRKKRNDLKPVIPRTTGEGYVIPSDVAIEDLAVSRISVSTPLPPKGSTDRQAGDYCVVGNGAGNIVGEDGTWQPSKGGELRCVPNRSVS